MILPSVIVFINEKKREEFLRLQHGSSEERALYELINKKIDLLTNDASIGKQIAKRLIPKEYRNFFNLWKVNLNKKLRLIYSINADENGRLTVIIDWLDHKEYESLFHYRVR